MKKVYLLSLVWIALIAIGVPSIPAQQNTQPIVVLYSSLKHQHDQARAFFDFQQGTAVSRSGRWDVGYGSVYSAEQFDWFQSSPSPDNRSVIKDLGRHAWSEDFKVPVIKPLAKLRLGERRQISVDLSGGPARVYSVPGVSGDASDPGIDDRLRGSTDNPKSNRPMRDFGEVAGPSGGTVLSPKNDARPRVDPLFVKAIVGHVYVIHVVDASRDFYALFRVEALLRGDSCTISWKMMP
jgi:hypothetical protein